MKAEKHSHIDADEMQKAYLEAENNNAGKFKAQNIAMIAAFFAFIYIFAALFWILPDKEISVEENRDLASAPTLTVKSLADGTYTKDFADYMADQFPARGFFVGLKAASERLLLKGGNNGIIFGDDGYLVKRFDSVDEETLAKNAAYICEFVKGASSRGVAATVAVAGRTVDVASSVTPSYYGGGSSDKTRKLINDVFKSENVGYTDLAPALKERFDAGEYVYYKTDHHWTSLGAYYAYCELCPALGAKAHSLEEFERETASASFYGTTWSACGAKWIKPDYIEFFRYDADADLVTDRQDEAFDGLYDTKYLEEKDKYSAFLGGNATRIDVTSKSEEREKLLIVKDSFFHSLAPFFARDFDLVIIDLRYYNGSVIELCEEEGIDRALILMNVETLSEQSGLMKLKMGFDN
ncbi:MAG: hypothetical protein IKN38_07225 [Clostridia bacterium]|nr:hypothetical protein [Clostridia bacterium]